MDMNVSYKHFMCRLCLRKTGTLSHIYSCNVGSGLNAAEAIFDLLKLEVSASDCYPKLVCLECLNKLHEFQNFKDSCWRAKTYFDTSYSNSEVSDVNSVRGKNNCGVNRANNNSEFKESSGEHPNPRIEEFVDENCLIPEINIKEEPAEDSEMRDPLCLEPPESNIREILEEELTIQEEEIKLNEREIVNEVPVTSVRTRNTSTQGISLQTYGNRLVKRTVCPAGSSNTSNSNPFLLPARYLVLNIKRSVPTNSYLGLVPQNGINFVQGIEKRSENQNPISNAMVTKEAEKNYSSVQYTCRNCSKKFPSESELANHNCVAQMRKDLECKECGERFPTEKDLWNHLKNHKLNFHFYCRVCGKNFPSEDKLYQHYSVHENETPPSRPRPVLVSYPVPSIPSGVVVNDVGQIQKSCEKGVIFPNIDVATRAMKKQVGNAKSETKIGVPCPFCKRFYRNEVGLQRHIYEVHSERKFECNICHKKFRTEKCVERHAALHSANRPYRCEICGKGFYNKNAFSKHASYHAGDAPFQCDRCGKKCTHKRQLWIHIGSCYKTKTYECSVCKKKFTTQWYLTSHMTIHTGEKKLVCEVCGKSFRAKKTLVIHKRQHTGEKPYHCEICDRKFVQKTSLSLHTKKHHQ